MKNSTYFFVEDGFRSTRELRRQAPNSRNFRDIFLDERFQAEMSKVLGPRRHGLNYKFVMGKATITGNNINQLI